MKEFYWNLKQKRLEKGLTLEEIHRHTRLPLKYLEAIEDGALERLPRGYEKIYIRRYVKEIGLDEEEVMRDFEVLTGQLTPSESQSAPENKNANEAPDREEESRQPADQPRVALSNWTRELAENLKKLNLANYQKYFWMGLSLLVLIVVGYFSYQQYVFEKKNQIDVKEITISQMIEEFQKQDSLLTSPISNNTVVRAQGRAGLRVELHALHRTWIKEIRDEKDTTDYILPPGLRRTIEANQRVKFILGRADGVEISLNGQAIGILGDADEVVLSLILTPEGVAEKRLKKVQIKNPVRPDSTGEGAVGD